MELAETMLHKYKIEMKMNTSKREEYSKNLQDELKHQKLQKLFKQKERG